MGTTNTWYENTYVPYSYTIKYTSTSGETTYYDHFYDAPRKPVKRRAEPELNAGDTAALDDFLGGFNREKK